MHVFPLLILGLWAASPAPAATGPWDLAALRQPPRILAEGDGAVRTLSYAGEPYRGKPTRVFAYLGIPDKAEGKSPAMVLVHGGGGTAFKEWVELWRKRGYVALAMDLAGCGADGKRLPDGGPGQGDGDKFFPEGGAKEFWTYHAVAAVIRGVSLLAARPKVDATRIGITGISWGGYLTCIVAGLDDRLRVAVPVYGCGFLHENSVWNGTFARLKPQRRAFWVEQFEPSRYLGGARMPVLFVNGTNDFAYPLDSYQKSYRLVKDRQLAVTVRLPHSHPAGWAPPEIARFVDAHLRQGAPLARIVASRRDGRTVEVCFQTKVPVKTASLCWTGDGGPWQKREWRSKTISVEGEAARGELPAGPLVWFATLTDERGSTVSTEHEVVAAK